MGANHSNNSKDPPTVNQLIFNYRTAHPEHKLSDFMLSLCNTKEVLRWSNYFQTFERAMANPYFIQWVEGITEQTLKTFPPHVSSPLLSFLDFYFLSSEIKEPSWRRLYCSQEDGHNWTRFSNSLQESECSLIVIRDTKGFIFGGFASQPWTQNPNFYGNSDSFLFMLHPSVQIFHASGYNSNYQYFNSNSKTFPNGLGFGGQLDYFGLFISQEFDKGCCRCEPTSSTYLNTSLASEPDFPIDKLQVWSTKERVLDERLLDKRSALTNFESESYLLEMAGKQMYSKDLPKQENL